MDFTPGFTHLRPPDPQFGNLESGEGADEMTMNTLGMQSSFWGDRSTGGFGGTDWSDDYEDATSAETQKKISFFGDLIRKKSFEFIRNEDDEVKLVFNVREGDCWETLADKLYKMNEFEALEDLSICMENEGREIHFYDLITYPKASFFSFSKTYRKFLVFLHLLRTREESDFYWIPKDVLSHKIIPFLSEMDIVFSVHSNVKKVIKAEIYDKCGKYVPSLKPYHFECLEDLSNPYKTYSSLIVIRRNIEDNEVKRALGMREVYFSEIEGFSKDMINPNHSLTKKFEFSDDFGRDDSVIKSLCRKLLVEEKKMDWIHRKLRRELFKLLSSSVRVKKTREGTKTRTTKFGFGAKNQSDIVSVIDVDQFSDIIKYFESVEVMAEVINVDDHSLPRRNDVVPKEDHVRDIMKNFIEYLLDLSQISCETLFGPGFDDVVINETYSEARFDLIQLVVRYLSLFREGRLDRSFRYSFSATLKNSTSWDITEPIPLILSEIGKYFQYNVVNRLERGITIDEVLEKEKENIVRSFETLQILLSELSHTSSFSNKHMKRVQIIATRLFSIKQVVGGQDVFPFMDLCLNHLLPSHPHPFLSHHGHGSAKTFIDFFDCLTRNLADSRPEVLVSFFDAFCSSFKLCIAFVSGPMSRIFKSDSLDNTIRILSTILRFVRIFESMLEKRSSEHQSKVLELVDSIIMMFSFIFTERYSTVCMVEPSLEDERLVSLVSIFCVIVTLLNQYTETDISTSKVSHKRFNRAVNLIRVVISISKKDPFFSPKVIFPILEKMYRICVESFKEKDYFLPAKCLDQFLPADDQIGKEFVSELGIDDLSVTSRRDFLTSLLGLIDSENVEQSIQIKKILCLENNNQERVDSILTAMGEVVNIRRDEIGFQKKEDILSFVTPILFFEFLQAKSTKESKKKEEEESEGENVDDGSNKNAFLVKKENLLRLSSALLKGFFFSSENLRDHIVNFFKSYGSLLCFRECELLEFRKNLIQMISGQELYFSSEDTSLPEILFDAISLFSEVPEYEKLICSSELMFAFLTRLKDDPNINILALYQKMDEQNRKKSLNEILRRVLVFIESDEFKLVEEQTTLVEKTYQNGLFKKENVPKEKVRIQKFNLPTICPLLCFLAREPFFVQVCPPEMIGKYLELVGTLITFTALRCDHSNINKTMELFATLVQSSEKSVLEKSFNCSELLRSIISSLLKLDFNGKKSSIQIFNSFLRADVISVGFFLTPREIEAGESSVSTTTTTEEKETQSELRKIFSALSRDTSILIVQQIEFSSDHSQYISQIEDFVIQIVGKLHESNESGESLLSLNDLVWEEYFLEFVWHKFERVAVRLIELGILRKIQVSQEEKKKEEKKGEMKEKMMFFEGVRHRRGKKKMRLSSSEKSSSAFSFDVGMPEKNELKKNGDDKFEFNPRRLENDDKKEEGEVSNFFDLGEFVFDGGDDENVEKKKKEKKEEKKGKDDVDEKEKTDDEDIFFF